MDVGDLVGVAHAFETPGEELQRVPVFRVDDDLLIAVLRRAQQFSHALELRLLAARMHGFGQGNQLLHLAALVHQLREAGGDERPERVGLTLFVFLGTGGRGLLVCRLRGQDVHQPALAYLAVQALLLTAEFVLGHSARLDVIDQGVEFGEAVPE